MRRGSVNLFKHNIFLFDAWVEGIDKGVCPNGESRAQNSLRA